MKFSKLAISGAFALLSTSCSVFALEADDTAELGVKKLGADTMELGPNLGADDTMELSPNLEADDTMELSPNLEADDTMELDTNLEADDTMESDDTMKLGSILGAGSVLDHIRDNENMSDFLQLVEACNDVDLTRLVSEEFTTDYKFEGEKTLAEIEESVLLAFIPTNDAFSDRDAYENTLSDPEVACDVVAGHLAIADKSNFQNSDEVIVTTLFGTELNFEDAESPFEENTVVFETHIPFTKSTIDMENPLYVPGPTSDDDDGTITGEDDNDGTTTGEDDNDGTITGEDDNDGTITGEDDNDGTTTEEVETRNRRWGPTPRAARKRNWRYRRAAGKARKRNWRYRRAAGKTRKRNWRYRRAAGKARKRNWRYRRAAGKTRERPTPAARKRNWAPKNSYLSRRAAGKTKEVSYIYSNTRPRKVTKEVTYSNTRSYSNRKI